MSSSPRLAGKVGIITGAAQGIGLATALKFVQEGARVVVCDVRQAAVDQAVTACQAAGAEALGIVVDVTQREMVDGMVQQVKDRFGRIDVLVNNAGITQDARLQKMTLEQFDRVIDVNLRGVFHCAQAVCDTMVAQGSGVIRCQQVRRDWVHQDLEPGTRPQRHSRERGGARLYCHPHSLHHSRESDARDGGPRAPQASGPARGHCPCLRVPRQ